MAQLPGQLRLPGNPVIKVQAVDHTFFGILDMERNVSGTETCFYEPRCSG
jgi:hypothetical protein